VKILQTRNAVNSFLESLPFHNSEVGFVPTMGALHQGHLELIKEAKKRTDIVIVSIFVNPIQFNNSEDFEKYPKTLELDLQLLSNQEVDAVFIPEPDEIYPEDPLVQLNFGYLENILEGAFRPGHFNGVGIVVAKLFNMVKPHQAFFGQKDLQQVAVIKRLVEDLSFDVEVIVVPTVRAASGLALSSRNLRMSNEEREHALVLIKTLTWARNALLNGMEWSKIILIVKKEFSIVPNCKLEYFELLDFNSFKIIERFTKEIPISICVAAYIGDVRLIDNISVNH
jgi:pantoate--beta-alanine ligase